MDRIGELLPTVTAHLGDPPHGPIPLGRCGIRAWQVDDRSDEESCDGLGHHRGGVMSRRCPSVVSDENRERATRERERLAGPLSRLVGGPLFASYDPQRHPAGERALAAMKAFASVRLPTSGVLLSGETGLGKSHLLLASHLARLDAGWPSVYVTSSDLRPLFRDASAWGEERSTIARDRLEAFRCAPVLHIDDLGDVRGSDAFHADFAAGFKALLDGTGAVLAVALNLGSVGARAHPDIGDRVLSRLLQGVEVVRLEGEDQRIAVGRSA